ncbi:MAG TPA: serine/threonine-protein kinase, partial [Planctomycetota bacterium]|nr:serine/threonine-protein kinase [Planctomycetota bacterium]
TAIKIVRCDAIGERSLARFEREVQLTSRLTHPNTISIYDYGRTEAGVFYYAMEYLAGMTLEDLVKGSGAQPPGRVVHILRQVCASLSEAHEMGLIHRDIKAANVILCERGGLHDVAKVVDFGLVKDIENLSDVTLSAVNTISGTPHYLSPEAIRSPSEVDGRSDLYAVGVLGYYLLTGMPLFETQSFVEVCSHHLHTAPIPPSVRASAPIPPDLEALILRALEKIPARRPPSARAFQRELEACASAGEWGEDDARAWWERFSNRLEPRQGPSASDPTLSGTGLSQFSATVVLSHPPGRSARP